MLRVSKISLLVFALWCILLSSCQSQKRLAYIQDMPIDTVMKVEERREIIIQPQDIVSIVVSSIEPKLSIPFNLPIASYQAGGENVSSQQKILGYTVDLNGEIDFPILGKLKVEGLTLNQLSLMIKERLIADDYINDPVVTVSFLNLKVHIIGEVTRPGTYSVSDSHITLLEALSLAGDLTVHGQRENVKIIREKNGERTVYMVDLKSPDIFSSPAYYMQQNDIIYVEPNKYKARQSTNTNQFTQVSLWVSIASLIATITTLIIR